MEEQASKVRRSSNLIKGFMTLVVVMQVTQFYQTNTIDMGSVAGSVAILSLLRALLLSPLLLVAPLRRWFKENVRFSQESHKYLLLAFILILVSAI
ncbi:MAG: hypothetical protein ABJV04_11900 [Aliiglaciecola sp.]|uniref:hypothetical protein n=1 Tax=Aliiglaciecola sp. TaxID=1872441 RepID=UPI003297CE0F